jgi:hypothetical protein
VLALRETKYSLQWDVHFGLLNPKKLTKRQAKEIVSYFCLPAILFISEGISALKDLLFFRGGQYYYAK